MHAGRCSLIVHVYCPRGTAWRAAHSRVSPSQVERKTVRLFKPGSGRAQQCVLLIHDLSV